MGRPAPIGLGKTYLANGPSLFPFHSEAAHTFKTILLSDWGRIERNGSEKHKLWANISPN